MGICRLLISVLRANLVQKLHTLCILPQFFSSSYVLQSNWGRRLSVCAKECTASICILHPPLALSTIFLLFYRALWILKGRIDADLPFSGVPMFLILCILSACEVLCLFSPTFPWGIYSFDDWKRLWSKSVYSVLESHVGAILFLFFNSGVWYYPRSLV